MWELLPFHIYLEKWIALLEKSLNPKIFSWQLRWMYSKHQPKLNMVEQVLGRPWEWISNLPFFLVNHWMPTRVGHHRRESALWFSRPHSSMGFLVKDRLLGWKGRYKQVAEKTQVLIQIHVLPVPAIVPGLRETDGQNPQEEKVIHHFKREVGF